MYREGMTEPIARDPASDTAALGMSDADGEGFGVPSPLDAGRFVFETLLGRGGMGTVWRGRDTRLGRVVALKLIRAEVAQRPEWRVGWHEARAIAQLESPFVPRVYDLIEEPSRACIVMELVPGESLAARLRRDGPLSIDTTMILARGIATALDAAHSRGIAHRDIKPGNVMMVPATSVGGVASVRLVDWGLALGVPQWDAQSKGDDPFRFAGTPHYMAPEQLRGEASRQSDIWSFGCVLYECLTGHRAFVETGSDLLRAITAGAIDLDRLPAQTTPLLRELIARCLRADPVERLRDIGEALPLASSGGTSLSNHRERMFDDLAPVPGAAVPREALIGEIIAALREERAVSLHGPAGVGKSWVARRVARRAIEDPSIGCQAGAIVVDLRDDHDIDSARRRTLAALDPQGVTPPRGDAATLRSRLAQTAKRGLLLVLDNADDVIGPVRDLLDAIRVPGLRTVVVASRAVSESNWTAIEVDPLECPPEGGDRSGKAIAAAPAVQLFVEMANARRRSFRLDTTNAGAIVEACRRVGGLPAAIELAAAQVAYSEPAEIVERLDEVLASETAGRSGSGRPLHWAIESCIVAASDDERVALERLAVFEGSWTDGSAHEICCDDALPDGRLQTALVGLIDRSLVRFVPSAGSSRYRVVETVRSHVRRRMVDASPTGRWHMLRDRHARRIMDLVASASPNLGAPAAILVSLTDWLRRIEHDLPDALVAMAWSARSGDAVTVERAVDAALVLQRLWFARGRYAEGIAHIDALLRRYGERGDTRHVRLLAARGQLRFQTDPGKALLDYRAALSLQRSRMATVSIMSIMPTHESRGEQTRLAAILHNIGLCARNLGDDQAMRSLARSALEEADAMWKETGDRVGEAAIQLSFAVLALGEDCLDVAAVHLAAATPVFEQSGDSIRLGTAIHYAAHLALLRGELGTALSECRRSIRIRRRTGEPEGIADGLRLAGLIAARAGDSVRAARLFGAASMRRTLLGAEVSRTEKPALDRAINAIRESVGRAAFADAFTAGEEFTDDEADREIEQIAIP